MDSVAWRGTELEKLIVLFVTIQEQGGPGGMNRMSDRFRWVETGRMTTFSNWALELTWGLAAHLCPCPLPDPSLTLLIHSVS